MDQVCVLTFASVYHAMRAEKILAAADVVGKLIPIPRSMSANCHGLGLIISIEDRERVVAMLKGTGVFIERNVLLSRDEI